MARKVPVRNGLGGGGAGAAEGVVGGAGAGYLVAGASGQNAGAAQMVAENVEEAIVGDGRVARNAGGNGLVAQRIQAALRLAVGKEQVIEVGLAFAGAEANLATAKSRAIAVLVAINAIHI